MGGGVVGGAFVGGLENQNRDVGFALASPQWLGYKDPGDLDRLIT